MYYGSNNEERKLVAWQKAAVIPGANKNIWRRDRFERMINWNEYGNRGSKFGWVIDHIFPRARGGGDEPSNLEALHYVSNEQKSDLLI
ncbi:MAG: HNH endonuclease signature motif containing protein [Pseudomonadota bacterium]